MVSFPTAITHTLAARTDVRTQTYQIVHVTWIGVHMCCDLMRQITATGDIVHVFPARSATSGLEKAPHNVSMNLPNREYPFHSIVYPVAGMSVDDRCSGVPSGDAAC